ncbi:DUF4339 domain-containing protein [Fimbriimonas ginsengisoli]|uniref:GYF domain-containing protein n=1 Tax=Fimbriimonas ginsengisoli Gsoil 348 TaxID=661478 RepID=A0A068NZ23_FIMGI|nr:DUF4339 domain-containing protein [Fimbriimonas ginsengisoli]AIE87824.1 hypothetical protein OP10G_4456 [Fimbriimonas ginsengisoli Gsoil 348]
MEYFVIGADGKEYGPATLDQLRQWAQEGRVMPHTMLKNFNTGQVAAASTISGIFPDTAGTVPPPGQGANWNQPPSPYPRQAVGYAVDDGNKDIWGAIIRSVLALVFFFAFHGIGLIFAAYGVYYAIQANSKGHRHGKTALAISIVTLVVIGIGWLLRAKAATGS